MTQRAEKPKTKALISAETFQAFQTGFVALVFIAIFGSLFVINALFTINAVQTIAAHVAVPAVIPADVPSRAIVQIAIWLLDWRLVAFIVIALAFFEAWGWQANFKGISITAKAVILFDVCTTIYGLYLVGLSQGLAYNTPWVVLYIALALVAAVLMAIGPEYAVVDALGYVGFVEAPKRKFSMQSSQAQQEAARRQQAQQEAARRQQAQQEAARRQQAEQEAAARKKQAQRQQAEQKHQGAQYVPDDLE